MIGTIQLNTNNERLSLKDKLSSLTPEQFRAFHEEVLSNVYSRSFFEFNGLDYVNPDMEKVRQITFKQYFKRIAEA